LRLEFKHNLPFVELTAVQNGRAVRFSSVLIDTGSASTILSIDELTKIGVAPAPNDIIHRIRGVGGVEAVFRRRIDLIELAEISVRDFAIEVGALDYGFDIQGIIGTDFLVRTRAVIDLSAREVRFPG
jgi:predicted aspartyl protease